MTTWLSNNYWEVDIVLNEEGDVRSGNDMPCEDGKYRKMKRACEPAGYNGMSKTEAAAKHEGPGVYAVYVRGPFSLSR